MSRKNLTEEEKTARKKAKAEKERARYKKAREAGFSPDEARSIQKTIKKQPELLQGASETMLDLVSGMRGLAELLTPEPKKRGRTSRKGTPEKKGRTSRHKDYSDFESFIMENPNKSANQLIKEWRSLGNTVGTQRGKDLVRETKGLKKHAQKVTRFSYKSPEEISSRFRKTYHVKKRYVYLVKFEVESSDLADAYPDYLHITSNRMLDLREVKEATLQAWEDGTDSRDAKYKGLRIIEESIEVLYAVDMNK